MSIQINPYISALQETQKAPGFKNTGKKRSRQIWSITGRKAETA